MDSSRRRFLVYCGIGTAAATEVALELSGMGPLSLLHRLLFSNAQSFPLETQIRLTPSYTQGPDGRIYVSDAVLSSPSELEAFKEGIIDTMSETLENQGMLEQIADLQITGRKMQFFVDPLRERLDASRFYAGMAVLRPEFQNLDVNPDYSFIPLHSIDEILVPRNLNSPRTARIVDKFGEETRIYFTVTYIDGQAQSGDIVVGESLHPGFTYTDKGVRNGEVVSNIPDVFISRNVDDFDLYGTLYCELLHKELIDPKMKLFRQLTEVRKREQMSVIVNNDYATAVTNLTDEVVVHGLFAVWLKESMLNLGLDNEECNGRLGFLESMPDYRGVPLVKELAMQKGRRAVIDGYRANPLAYWQMLLAKVPEYREVETLRQK